MKEQGQEILLEKADHQETDQSPKLEQASALYKIGRQTQTLDIFTSNRVFSKNFELSMLNSRLDITGFERVNDKTIRLTLSKLPEAGEEAMTFYAGAVEGAEKDLTVSIQTKTPEIYVDEKVWVSEKNPVISFMTNLFLEEPPELSFRLGGALEGLTVSKYSWTTCGGRLELEGTAKAGAAVLAVEGLFCAQCQFEVDVSAPVESFPENSSLSYRGDDTLDGEAVLGNLEGELAPGAEAGETVTKMTEGAGKAATAMAAMSHVSTAISIVSGAFSILKSLDSLFGWGIFPDPNEELKKEIGKINSKLDELNRKVTEIGETTKATMTLMMAGFTELDYNNLESIMKKERTPLDPFFDDYNGIINTKNDSVREEKLINLVNLKSDKETNGSKMLEKINYLVKVLDPYDNTGAIENGSLTYKYFKMVMAGTPFYHTSAQLFMAYTQKWTAELVMYSVIMGIIYQHNILYYPEYGYADKMAATAKKITKASENIGKFFNKQGAVQLNALDNLMVRGYLRDYAHMCRYEREVKGILLVLNRDGKQFIFDNIGTFIAKASRPNYLFFRTIENESVKYDSTEAGKNYINEFFSGPNSMFTLYGAGMTFNNFMKRYINCDKVEWIAPDEIMIERYKPSGKKIYGLEREEALFADANVEGFVTKRRDSFDCLNNKKIKFARVFMLKDAYSQSKPPKRSYISNIHFTAARSPADALKNLQKISMDIKAADRLCPFVFKKEAIATYFALSRSEDPKDAITDMFVHTTKTEKEAPKTLEVGGRKYHRFEMDLYEGASPKNSCKWLYYIKDTSVDFPILKIKTGSFDFTLMDEVLSKDGESVFVSRSTEGPMMLYCSRAV